MAVLPFFSAGPICNDFSCSLLLVTLLLPYAWVPIALILFIAAAWRWKKRGIDKVTDLLIVLGLLACLGYLPIHQRKHQFDTESKIVMQKISDQFYWADKTPQGWKLERVVAPTSEENTYPYLVAKFTLEKGNIEVYQYREVPLDSCGYRYPGKRMERIYSQRSDNYVMQSTKVPAVDCRKAFVRTDGIDVYSYEQGSEKSYFFNLGELHVTVNDYGIDSSVEGYIQSLKLVPPGDVPLGLHDLI